MPHSTVSLTADEVDDLIYFSRAGDLEELRSSIEAFSKNHACSAHSIVTAAIDVDEEGLGSGSCLLHYPAANGNTDIVTYLLSLIQDPVSASASAVESAATTDSIPNGVSDDTATKPASSNLVNHQNVSGNTPLHWAGMNGHLAIVQALVGAGADPEIVNAAGRDAVVESEWSSKDGAAECANWILKECGALEKGVGDGVEEGEGSERLVADEEKMDVQEDAGGSVEGSG